MCLTRQSFSCCGCKGLSCRTQASGDSWGLLSGSLWGRVAWVPAGTPSLPAGGSGQGQVCWPVQLSCFSVCDNFTVTVFGGEFIERATHYVKLYKSEAVGTSMVVRPLPLSSAGTFSPLQRRPHSNPHSQAWPPTCICDFVMIVKKRFPDWEWEQ